MKVSSVMKAKKYVRGKTREIVCPNAVRYLVYTRAILFFF